MLKNTPKLTGMKLPMCGWLIWLKNEPTECLSRHFHTSWKTRQRQLGWWARMIFVVWHEGLSFPSIMWGAVTGRICLRLYRRHLTLTSSTIMVWFEFIYQVYNSIQDTYKVVKKYAVRNNVPFTDTRLDGSHFLHLTHQKEISDILLETIKLTE